jgi:hypothetical protein
MSFDKDYADRSDTKKGFEAKVRKLEKEGFGRVSATGYTDTLMGVDDLDRVRRVKLNKDING